MTATSTTELKKFTEKVLIIGGWTAALGISYCIARRLSDQLCRKLYNYPPGNNGLLFVGNLLQFANPSFLLELKEKYGDLYMLQVGARRILIIGDSQLCRKLYSQYKYCNRDYMELFRTFEPFARIKRSICYELSSVIISYFIFVAVKQSIL